LRLRTARKLSNGALACLKFKPVRLLQRKEVRLLVVPPLVPPLALFLVPPLVLPHNVQRLLARLLERLRVLPEQRLLRVSLCLR
jgi:hypothetical protein